MRKPATLIPQSLLTEVLALVNVGLTHVADGAKCLKVFKDGFPALTPWNNMIDMQLDTGFQSRTYPTSTASKPVTSQYAPT
jgi:hypothetical protein